MTSGSSRFSMPFGRGIFTTVISAMFLLYRFAYAAPFPDFVPLLLHEDRQQRGALVTVPVMLVNIPRLRVPQLELHHAIEVRHILLTRRHDDLVNGRVLLGYLALLDLFRRLRCIRRT